MRYGFSVPCFGHPATLVDLGIEAEVAGWDGFFVWDHMLFIAEARIPIVDPWIVLAAVAASTTRVRLGPTVTPLARRRAPKVAREAVTLDHLSDGRAVLGVGLGWPADDDFDRFGDPADARTRAEILDESLDAITALWSGEPATVNGVHVQVRDVAFRPRPRQRPRIPIWVAGEWPNRRPFERAARWDGVVPLARREAGLGSMTPDEVVDMLRFVGARRPADAGPFEVCIGGGPGGAADLGAYAEAGATWWLEGTDGRPGWEDEVRARIRSGPPR